MLKSFRITNGGTSGIGKLTSANNFNSSRRPSTQDSEDDVEFDEAEADYDDDALVVDIEVILPESNQGSDFATLIWDSSIVLSWYLINVLFCSNNKKNIPLMTTTLELGAGTALPSLVACSLGADTIITDRLGSDSNGIFENVRNIIRHNQNNGSLINKLSPRFIELSYGMFSSQAFELPSVDYLFASDLFYNNTRDYDDIFSTFAFFANKNKNINILFCYQVRSVEKTISYLMSKWNFVGEEIEKDFLPMDVELKSEVILFRIRPKSHSS
ncbi:hypothetical protein SAMD00019534_083690 [Acytostelium subglobosum LB1]|uniref:hypothetical protein n=1 Tax=Acytostelium subglobosum LB1 TaxID=1410327 RepID=UPI000644DE76|nr:hypothetical protein SAMD00019534_083690 [Acytostelium subglobosum LB1]GAM25194.1 hypothetical protein SAMD00019534_083690 [Acytostelium subglobosum LB1]|eukprot:XP_012751714.1 hypothetical protein SAMD00019534_083690 [Acytostelium subglobosum LB1]